MPAHRITYQVFCSIIIFNFLFSSAAARSQDLQGQVEKAEFVCIDSIRIEGNKITRDRIILREIIFATGDTVETGKLDSLVALSNQNLLNTSLFNFVEIRKIFHSLDQSHVVVEVKVTERWYIWPTPILKISDRNFNVWWQTKDFSRLSYGFYIDWKNFTGRKDHLILKLQWGYNRVAQLQYTIPYINRKQTIGMGFGTSYAQQKETAYQTMYNKQEFFKEPDDGFSRQEISAYGQVVVRPSIYNTHQVTLSYDRHYFSDSLVASNVNYTADSSGNVQYLSFDYLFKCDHRDFKPYPLKGFYIDVELLKHGLWTFEKNTLNTVHLMATFRKYWELHPRFYFATGINGKLSSGLQPYFVIRGIGYNRDMVRSYEYYLVDAQHFAIWKNNIKFAIIPQQSKTIRWIRTEKFSKVYYALYLDLFFDAGYGYYDQDFGRETNDLQNEFLLGYGAGIDFVTYYDVVMRFEFSVNRMNETGFFLHFQAPI